MIIHINNLALQAGITTLLIQIDLNDTVRELVRQVAFRDMMSQTVGRLATIKSVLLTKELAEGLTKILVPCTPIQEISDAVLVGCCQPK